MLARFPWLWQARCSRAPTDRCTVTLVTDDEGSLLVWERNFRETMKRTREAHGWTQTELARRVRAHGGLAFHQQTIDRIESGKRPVRLNEAHVIAQELNTPLEAMTSFSRSHSERELQVTAQMVVRDAGYVAADLSEAAGQWYDSLTALTYLVSQRRDRELGPPSTWDSATLWGMRFVVEAHELGGRLDRLLVDFRRAAGEENFRLVDDGLAADIEVLAEELGRLREGAGRSPRTLADLASGSPAEVDASLARHELLTEDEKEALGRVTSALEGRATKGAPRGEHPEEG